MDDNSTLYFEPGHQMERTDKDDIIEFKISDNITAALAQIDTLRSMMQQVDSTQPPSMGDAGQASTTATAFAGASYATGERANYKSLTFENTALLELYWMIQQMTAVFAKPETGMQLMGEKVFDFNPDRNYFYKPLSQSIEPEYSKMAKRKEWTTILGYLMQAQHPDAVKMVNYIMGEIVKLMGDEYENFSEKFLDEAQPMQQQEGGVGMVQQGGMPVSNQNNVPMSGAEMGTRGIADIGTF
jgi:hypothetical protein